MGDIILTTPVIRALKNQKPESEIHYIVRENFSETIKNNPYIDQVIIVKKRAMEAYEKCKTENYDFILDLHNNHHNHLLHPEHFQQKTTKFNCI